MGIIIDSENIIDSLDSAPDRLRAEIGSYRTFINEQLRTANFRSGIADNYFLEIASEDSQLIPTKKARIFISGREDQFRDQVQWNEYVNGTIRTGAAFLDHQFSFNNPEITNSFVKNYHDPDYEDITKEYDSNQLLNYNLISYRYKDEIDSVATVGDLRTSFDGPGYMVDSGHSLRELMREFPNRITNYSGLPEEIELKQRNIFDLQKPFSFELPYNYGTVTVFAPLMSPVEFPFYYSKTLPELRSFSNGKFNNILSTYGKRKNVFQSIKRDLSFSNRSFNVEGINVSAKIYNFIDLMTTTRIINIVEQPDELFLVSQGETDYADITSRFANQVNTVRFLSEMRDFIGGPNGAREIQDIMFSHSCNTFFLGYKIEKYLNNDAGRPIQTYYTNDANFYDTQLKQGIKYIYKTKVLLGVLGSSYTYTNLFISQNETDMMAEDGSLGNPPIVFGNDKYRAYVDVEATPSFQILEYEVDVDEVAFVDTPTLPPQVEFRNNSKKANVEFFFSPMFARVESVTRANGSELIRPLQPLTEEDERIADLVAISKTNGVRAEYFTGIYEVYRMSSPPVEEKDFMDHFLVSVDDTSGLTFPEAMGLRSTVLDNMNGYFEDFIVPNRKYYYTFRTMTYHGTPSNLTIPLEVELLRDSDEYKINVSQYKYPSEKNYTYEKPAKRIIKVIPNIERLLFDEVDEANKRGFTLDESSMLTKGQTTKFKIRVTSKHTGKKIDINLNLKLAEDTNSFSQN